jgi:hypothetical protein
LVAENDLGALVEVAGLFGEFCHDTPPTREHTEAVRNPNDSFISFGLESNDTIFMYQEYCTDPLFTMDFDAHGLAEVNVVDKVGTTHRFVRNPPIYFGLIVKYRPRPEDHPDTTWIFCAGLGAQGTVGAAWYLVDNWKRLHKQVGTSDFIAVIEVHGFAAGSATRKLLVTSDEIQRGHLAVNDSTASSPL